MRFSLTTRCLFAILLAVVGAHASEQTPLVLTEVNGSTDTEVYLPMGFKIEKLLTVPEGQGSWISLALDNKGRFITADQEGLLYRVTLPADGSKPAVTPITAYVKDANGKNTGTPIGSAQGLLWAFDSLYVVINGESALGSGLYRLRSSKNDDTLDTAELLSLLPGSGEHGPHGVTLGPDGLLYIAAGNDCGLPKWKNTRVPQDWGGDQLLGQDAQSWDWHSKNGAVPGGWVCRTDRDGKSWEIYCAGIRNHYRLAFNPDGELFTSDGDNEWQIGMPWYRPPRIYHIVSGADYGWRSGFFKWPVYFPDGLASVADLSTGGPSGIVFGTGAKFPARYQRALFALDWAYGKMYAVHLHQSGASYDGSVETFIRGKPLAFTDALIGNDGAMYFLTGGRAIESNLYRVTYVGHDDTAPVQPEPDADATKARALRRTLESIHEAGKDAEAGKNNADTAWSHLNDKDKYIRFAARVALEHAGAKAWQERLFKEQDAQSVLTASIALARCGDKSNKTPLLKKLIDLDWPQLSDPQRVELLRAVSLVFLRMGRVDRPDEVKLGVALSAHYPANSDLVDRELCRVLVFLQSSDVVEKTLPLLRSAATQEEQIQLGWALSASMISFTPPQRAQYAAWLSAALSYKGGREVQDTIKDLRHALLASIPAEDRPNWERKLHDAVPPPPPPPRRLVKRWTTAELTQIVNANLSGRNYEHGHQIYSEASCIRCHYFNGEGMEIGPDLTSVAARFNIKAIVESIVEPSKVIGDQYSAKKLKMKDGRSLYGRILCETNGKYEFAPDPMQPGESIAIDKSDVVSVKQSAVSVMPEDLLNSFTQDEILDLMAFLVSGGDKEDKVFKPKVAKEGEK
jgi:putative heme-binding domain-containing protein